MLRETKSDKEMMSNMYFVPDFIDDNCFAVCGRPCNMKVAIKSTPFKENKRPTSNVLTKKILPKVTTGMGTSKRFTPAVVPRPLHPSNFRRFADKSRLRE